MTVRFFRLFGLFAAVAVVLSPFAHGTQRAHGEREAGLPKMTRALLPAGAVVQAHFQAELNGRDEVTVYSIPIDGLESDTYILISRQGRKIRTMNVADIVPSGPAQFEKAVLARRGRQVFFAIGLGVNQAGTFFFAVAFQNGDYRVIFKRATMLGRIVLASDADAFALWEACCLQEEPPAATCTWCPHRYQITQYRWRDTKYIPGRPRKTEKHLDPEEFSNTPILRQVGALNGSAPY